jgi:hypothetical protein
LAEKWAAGHQMTPYQQAKALLMGEMADLDWPDVAQFYQVEDAE